MLSYIIAIIFSLSIFQGESSNETIRTGYIFTSNSSDSCLYDKEIIKSDSSYIQILYNFQECSDSIFTEQHFLQNDVLTKAIVNMRGSSTIVTDLIYDKGGNLTYVKKQILEKPEFDYLEEYENSYDDKNRLVKVIKKLKEIVEIKIIEYDSAGYSKVEKFYYPLNPSNIAAVQYYRDDKILRKVYVGDHFDDSLDEIWEYYPNGKLKSYTDEFQMVKYYYDKKLNLIEERKFSGRRPKFKLSQKITYTYNKENLLLQKYTRYFTGRNHDNSKWELIKYHYE